MDIPADLLDTIALEGLPSARGRRPTPLAISYIRDLNEADLEVILNPPPKGLETQPLAKLRYTHHLLARLIAEGRPNTECALITGYNPGRISILKQDPAFTELVAYYAKNAEEVYLDVHSRLAALGVASLEELQERLEAEPDKFTQNQLMALVELTFDRSVAPPKGGKGGGGGGTAPVFNISFETPNPEGAKVVIDAPVKMLSAGDDES